MTLNKTCNALICTILFGLTELYKITLFKVFILEIIKFKVAEIALFCFFHDFELNYLRDYILKKVILYDSDRPTILVIDNAIF